LWQKNLFSFRKLAYCLGNPGFGKSAALQHVYRRGFYNACLLRFLENDDLPPSDRPLARFPDYQQCERVACCLVFIFNRLTIVTDQNPNTAIFTCAALVLVDIFKNVKKLAKALQ